MANGNGTTNVCDAVVGQSWNNVLNYIKRAFGTKLNLLEMTDEEIIIGLKEDVLPFFSQYAPEKRYKFITDNNIIGHKAGNPLYQYKIPVEDGEYIIDVIEAYATKDTAIVDRFGGAIVSTTSAIDVVIANVYIDAVKSLNTRNTWEFVPPDMLIWDEAITTGVVVYNVPISNLNRMMPDLYHTIFKPLSLAFVKRWISALRNKYQGLSTQFGPIELNWEKLEAESREEIEKYTDRLEQLPPDILLYVDV